MWDWKDVVVACGLTFILGWCFGYVYGRTAQAEIDSAGAKSILKRIMRFFIFLFIVCLFPGCAYQNAGIKVYAPVTKVDKAGHTYQKMELKTAIAADLPGLRTLELGELKLTFREATVESQEPVYNRKGEVTQIIVQRYATGLYTSHVIRAQGNALKETINSGAAAATGVLVTIGGAVVTSGATALIP